MELNYEVIENPIIGMSVYKLLIVKYDTKKYVLASSNINDYLFMMREKLSNCIISSITDIYSSVRVMGKDITQSISANIDITKHTHFACFEKELLFEDMIEKSEESVKKILINDDILDASEFLFFRLIPILYSYFGISEDIDILSYLVDQNDFDEYMSEYADYGEDKYYKEKVVNIAFRYSQSISNSEKFIIDSNSKYS